MPIANCYIPPSINNTKADAIINQWATEANINAKDITLNFIHVHKQAGNPYTIMANLYLPSLWDGESVTAIQLSLAKALSQQLNTPIGQVFIMTHIVKPRHVVENGEVVSW